MKKFITLAFSILFTMTAFGQRLEYENSSKWFFGLNAGATWNTTDVQNKTYGGWGFVLGRSYNYDYGRRISYDLRLRYLRGKWYGQDTDSTNLSHLGADYSGALLDYKNGLGYTVNNFEADVHELGLELAIHFNRLRDRSGWDPYIFGGANIVWNETYGDLLNQDVFLLNDSLTYAYDQIEMNKPAIELALDDNYESALDGTSPSRYNVNFMPSLGVGLGYDFGPRFSMGIEHKTTFALKDDFDGYVDAEPNWGFLQNDVYHYTNAYLVWRFRNGEGRTRPTPQPQPDPMVNGIGGTTPCQFPEVRFTRPLQRTETVQSQTYVFKAEVNFVQSRSQIVMRVNGVQTTNFLYNHDTHQLESYLSLQPGNNVIEITGRNNCGTDTETATIVFDNCITPNVFFENVNSSTLNAEVEQRQYNVQAQITNATSIEFTVNGVRSTNFVYNSATGQFSSNILLDEGQNNIRIVAISACGTDVATGVITYTNCAAPFVSFTNGNGGFVAVSEANFNVSAYVYNAVSSNNIKLRVNGVSRNFNFNSSTNQLTANVNLNSGSNTIQISVSNNCGTDTETLTVEYTPCVNPSIQMLNPLAQSTTTANGVQIVKAKLYNVSNIGQVQLFVNGNIQQGGSYNAITREFQASVALNAGFNTIQITVLNDCGSDTETISVNYVPCNTPDVQLILPSANGTVVSSPSQLVQAMVFNVNNISEIQTFVNGSVQQGGTFNSANGLYQITVGLNLGVNTIQVVATNSCGSDVQTVSVTYRACEAPQITMVNPTTDPLFTTATNINVSAMIGAIANASQVQLMVNGVVDGTGASYSSASITYTNNVNLNVGNNNIKITATNSCGAVTKEINIVRELVVVNTPNEVDSIVICYPHSNNVGAPVTMTIPLSQWPAYQSQGAQLGACPVVDEPVDLPMTICYTVNGVATTMQILTSEWPAYQALGAVQGECVEETMDICFNGNELTIPVSQWSTYQAQGATEGPCPVVVEEKIIICHRPPGNPSNTQQLEIPLSAWPAHQAHGDVLGPCPTEDPEITICLNDSTMTILTSEWPAYQTQGATQGPCPVVVEEKIVICHRPPGNPSNTQQLEIPLSAWPAHQAHGDVLGPCPTEDPEMVICLNGVEKTILTSQWSTYQAQGATEGPCPVVDPEITICLNDSTMTILTSEWPTYQAQGATQGACPNGQGGNTGCMPNVSGSFSSDALSATANSTKDLSNVVLSFYDGTTQKFEGLSGYTGTFSGTGSNQGKCIVGMWIKSGCNSSGEGPGYGEYVANTGYSNQCSVDPEITICLVVNGVRTTKTIFQSEWATYQAQGAVLGPCPTVVDPKITICIDVNGVPTTKQILTSEWPAYQAQGATKGACPTVVDPLITICTEINGVRRTMTILTSQWPEYQAQGATEGPCQVEDPEMTICLNDSTMTILTSQWPTYRAQGAKKGACQNSAETMTICYNQETKTILISEWKVYEKLGATKGPCTEQKMTICYKDKTMEIKVSQWGRYQGLGATIGACTNNGSVDVNGQNVINSDSLNNTINRPTDGGGDEDELLFGNRTITICFTPEGSIASQTMQVPLSQWPDYQSKGATLGACAGTLNPSGGNGSVDTNTNGTSNENGVNTVPVNPNGDDGSGGNMPQIQNGSQEAQDEQLRLEKEAAEKARQEREAKEAAAKREQEEARRKAEAEKRKAAEAAAEKARQEQAAKEAAAKRAQEEARRKAEAEKRKAAEAAEKARKEQAAKEAAAKKAQEEAKQKAAKEAAAKKAAEEAEKKKAEEQRKQNEREGGR